MDIVLRIGTIFLSIVLLFFLAKLMGNKQISELTLFDYINGITIGSIAADLAIAKTEDVIDSVLALIIYGFVSVGISIIGNRSINFRRFVVGKSTILMKNGKIFYKAFKKTRIDINEFLVQCRTKGYFDLNEIEAAVFEPNGSLSILPKTYARPLRTSDMNLDLQKAEIMTSLVLDGIILKENLKKVGLNESWLTSELNKDNYKLDNIFIAYCDSNNKLTVFEKDMKNIKNDIFQ